MRGVLLKHGLLKSLELFSTWLVMTSEPDSCPRLRTSPRFGLLIAPLTLLSRRWVVALA